MKQIPFKFYSLTLITLTFLFISCGETEKKKPKTSFKDCDELIDYVEGRTHDRLVYLWGEGNIGKPYASRPNSTSDIEMEVKVTWSNVRCNGKPVKLAFTNTWVEGVTNAYDKNPRRFVSVMCSDYN